MDDRYSIERLESMCSNPDRDEILLPNKHNVNLWASSYIFASRIQDIVRRLNEGFSALDIFCAVHFRIEVTPDAVIGKMYLDYKDGTIETLFDCSGNNTLEMYQDFERELEIWKQETVDVLREAIKPEKQGA